MSLFVAEFKTLHYEILTGEFPQTNTLARLRGSGVFAPLAATARDIPKRGEASLDLVFVNGAVDHRGKWTDLSDDQTFLELSIALPESYMAWATNLLQQVEDHEVVSLLFGLAEGSDLENTILGHSSPRISDADG